MIITCRNSHNSGIKMNCIFGGEFVLNGKRIAVPIIIAGEKRKIFPGAAHLAARYAASLAVHQRACFAREVKEFNSVQPRDLTVLEGKD